MNLLTISEARFLLIRDHPEAAIPGVLDVRQELIREIEAQAAEVERLRTENARLDAMVTTLIAGDRR